MRKKDWYTDVMRLKRLSFETSYFEDYLSFFTEVLELDLSYLSDVAMELDFQGTILEIRQGSSVSPSQEFEFCLLADEFEAMMHKISFFYYRKGPTRFLLTHHDDIKCDLIDPDGRLWRFSQPSLKQTHFSTPASH